MRRVLVHVEGITEETFVNEVLARHLYPFGFSNVSARLLGNARQRERRGGIRAWPAVRKDIVRHLREDAKCLATTMVDFYALPHAGEGAWPGRAVASSLSFPKNARAVEQALLEDVSSEMGGGFDPTRFLPFVMMHEFEALLFSDCSRFADGIARPDLAPKFQSIRDGFASPEEIKDSPATAPSKRVQQLLPGYDKAVYGTLAVLEIGIEGIRSQCRHFNCWLGCLEQLAKS